MTRRLRARPKYFRTDEIDEFIRALEFTAECSKRISRRSDIWKWLIIALHNSVQGACVCALRGRDAAGISMLDKKSAEKVWDWLDVESRKKHHGPSPAERLAKMTELFCRVQQEKYLGEERLTATDEMISDVKKLNNLRNEFIHFVPRGWSLELSGMPRIVGNCCDAIEYLSVTRSTFWACVTENKKRRIRSALKQIKKSLNIS